jgi:hypothetical protein
MRKSFFVTLMFIGAFAAIHFATVCGKPRYRMAGAVMNGPSYQSRNGGMVIAWETEWRVDRWTGMEQVREVDYGRPSGWRNAGWRPLEALLG